MGNISILQKFRECSNYLNDIIDISSASISEDNEQLSLDITISNSTSFLDIVKNFTPFVSFLILSIELRIQQGSTTVTISDDGTLCIVTAWADDPDLSPPFLDSNNLQVVQRLTSYFEKNGNKIRPEIVAPLLEVLFNHGAYVNISAQITINKTDLLKKVDFPKNVRGVLYFKSDKLSTALNNFDTSKLQNIFAPNDENFIIVFLADVLGHASGTNIEVLGINCWEPDYIRIIPTDMNWSSKVNEALIIRDNECSWNFTPPRITPYHFALKTVEIEPVILCNMLNRICDYLCIAFISNKVLLTSTG